jgi:penicillin-binding protein 1A
VLTLLPGGPNREVLALDEIPDVVKDMVVAVEDQRFWDHSGWDGGGMLRAAMANVRAGEVAQGGSTISQQLAKENFAGNDRTLVRKAEELLYAVALEDRYDKPQLLEHYLNQVYLGSRAYGVAAAAREYFGVSVAGLSPDQAALLVGLIRSPASLDPRVHPEAARARRDAVLRIAANQGVLEPGAAETLAAVPIELVPPSPQATDLLLSGAVGRELLAEPALGATVEERAEHLATGGLQIETSIDPGLQEAATRAVNDGLSPWPGLGGALAAVDPQRGEVVALVGVNPPGTESFDLAAQGRRQPGSALKPLAAIAALEAGLGSDQELAGDGPVELEYAGGRRWTIDNFGGADHGSVNLEEALVSSVNTAFAQVAVATGAEPIVDVARRLGIDVEAAMGPANERGPSLALGALSRGVSPLEMASTYGALAAGGRHTASTIVTRVVDGHGRELLRRVPQPRPVLDPVVAATVTGFLQQAVDEGTGGEARLPGWQPAGKTGTSQQHADAWFVGAVPTLSVATWLGHPDAAQPVRRLTGGSTAAPVWRDSWRPRYGVGSRWPSPRRPSRSRRRTGRCCCPRPVSCPSDEAAVLSRRPSEATASSCASGTQLGVERVVAVGGVLHALARNGGSRHHVPRGSPHPAQGSHGTGSADTRAATSAQVHFDPLNIGSGRTSEWLDTAAGANEVAGPAGLLGVGIAKLASPVRRGRGRKERPPASR